jgi:hypothetical protein
MKLKMEKEEPFLAKESSEAARASVCWVEIKLSLLVLFSL